MDDNGENWYEIETKGWEPDLYENEYGDQVRINYGRFDYIVEHKLQGMDFIPVNNGRFMDKKEAKEWAEEIVMNLEGA